MTHKTVFTLITTAMMIIFCIMTTMVFAQTIPDEKPLGFPNFWYLITLALGMFTHWWVSYVREKVDVSFIKYLTHSGGQTITVILTSLGSFIAIWQMEPKLFVEPHLVAIIMTFGVAYGLDSAFGGIAGFKVKKQ